MDESTTVPENAAGGFRFGLRGMIVTTAVMGAIFALIRLWGLLIGLGAATGIALLAFTLIFGWAMIWRMVKGAEAENSRTMAVCESATFGIVALTSVLTISLIVAGGAKGLSMILGRRAVEAAWNQELGFTHQGVDIYRDPKIVHYLEITNVEPGGTFEAVGIREGEVIAVDQRRFFQMLETNRGSSITVDVGSGDIEDYWEDFTVRSVEIPIPN